MSVVCQLRFSTGPSQSISALALLITAFQSILGLSQWEGELSEGELSEGELSEGKLSEGELSEDTIPQGKSTRKSTARRVIILARVSKG